MKKKFTNILNKIKENKKRILQVLIGALTVFIFTFTVYNMNNPTKLNRLFASIGSVPNEAFEDSDFYSCIIDTYNNTNGTSKAYTDSLTDEELESITSLTCNWKSIESAKGIEKLTGLTTLNLRGNQLTSIDLSNNTKLTSLDLSESYILVNINLTKNTLLKELDIGNDGGRLSEINLSNNTALVSLNLNDNKLTSIDLSNNVALTDLNLGYNKLTNIDLSNNTALTELDLDGNYWTSVDISNNTLLTRFHLSESKLTNIDLSNNVNLIELDLAVNPLTSISGMENLTELTELNLEGDQLTELNLNNNTKLIYLYLTDNKLTSLDLSNNTNLSSLYIDGTPLIEDILMQNGDTYTIEEKIIPPSGQNFSYSVNDTSIASISGNTITALKEGSTRLRTSIGNVSFERKLVVGDVELKPEDINVQINNEENYIYFKEISSYLISDEEELTYVLRPNVGKIVRDGDTLKVVVGDKTYLEYKMVYFDGGALGTDDSGDYSVVVSSTEEPTKYNIKAVNCTYEFTKGGKEVIIKYNGNEIDRKKVVYMYLPNDYKFSFSLLYFGNNILDSSIINNIDNVSQIDKNKVNILNAKMTYETDDGNYFDIRDGEKRVSEYYPIYINSDNYDLSNDYIYLGTNDFKNDIKIFDNDHSRVYDFDYSIIDDVLEISVEHISFYSRKLIKVSSDIYDMSGDVIDLKGTELDISKINVTNANLKVDNDKLLVMYNDEVVKEFKLENGKKEDTTTKPSGEEKITTRAKVTTKQEVKTTTKKKSIINKIFGKNETTTKKEETTTTRKGIDIFKKNTSKDTTKVIDNTNKATSNSVNKKIIYQDNILLILSICLMFALSTCLIVVYRKSKENN